MDCHLLSFNVTLCAWLKNPYETDQNGSVAWQGPAQGMEAQAVLGISLIQMAIGWPPL